MIGRRKRQGGGEEGAPAWIVTFSDLMSLLLTFFVLLLSFSTVSEEEFKEAMMSIQGAFGVLDRFPHVISVAQLPPRRASNEAAEAARELQRQLQILGLEKQVKIEYDAMGGLKISLPSSILFDSGSATLKPEALPILRDVGEVLFEMPDTFIEVRGHTDSTPLAATGTYRDNYELSYFRADAVTRQLHTLGKVPMEQFEIVACGQSQPLATNTTEAGRQANRRVEIFVRGLVKKSRMESLEESFEDLSGSATPEEVPVSPRELNGLR